MTRTLDQRTLLRALLARQLLLERADLSIPDALAQIGGIQAQYAPSAYVGLWTRLARFRRDDLSDALEARSVVQGTLLRWTIHVVARRDYWPFALGTREPRRTWALRQRAASGDRRDAAQQEAAAAPLREALATGPRTITELEAGARGLVADAGIWLDLVRVPPSGTWEHRRADLIALAEDWIGPPDATEQEGRRRLVTAYLEAFGPAPWRDIATWAGMTVGDIRRGAMDLDLVTARAADGRELVDLPDAPLPDPDTPAPVRFLPHWDAVLLVHARRTGVLPERHRGAVFSIRNPFSVGTVLVDGMVAATWSVRDGQIVVTELERIRAADRDAIEVERAALERFWA